MTARPSSLLLCPFALPSCFSPVHHPCLYLLAHPCLHSPPPHTPTQIKWCVINRGFPIHKVNQNGPVQFFLYAVSE